MDINKLTRAEQIIGAAAIVFIISTFLPWFTAKASIIGIAQSDSLTGWEVGFLWGRFPAILALVMLLAIVLPAFADTKLPDLPITWGQAHLALGALIALLVVLKLAIGEDGGLNELQQELAEEMGFTVDRAWGLFIAAIAAVALAVGGFLKFNEEKSTAPGGAPTQF